MKKTRIQRALTLCLTLVFLLALLPGAALAYEISGDWEYTVSNGEATIIGYRGSVEVLTFPSVLDGYPVTSIGDWSFYNISELTSVTIPASVTSIGEDVFGHCDNLTSISVDLDNPNYCSVDGIVFSKDMSALIRYTAGRIGEYSIPDSVNSIGISAFIGCSGLTSVTIPDSVTRIEKEAFQYCDSLTSVRIPNSVTSIGSEAFSGCSNMIDVKISDSVTSIGTSAFESCWRLTSVTIPASVIVISDNMFEGCSVLASVTIPDSVTVINYKAFRSCSSLSDIYYMGSESQWDKIFIGRYNDSLTGATIHYNSTMPGAEKNPVEAEPQTLPTAYRYVPYHGYLSSTIEGSTFSLVSGSLPDGLSLNPYGVVTGLAKELGGFSFKVRETDGTNSTEYTVNMFVYVQSMTDVESSNWPGYGFVETAENHGRVQDQHVSSREELRDQIMYCEAPYYSFKELYIDAIKLTRNIEYYAEEGSTKITILAETIGDFGGGTHTVAAEFRSEIGESVYTVQNYTVTGIASKEVHVTVEGELVLWTDAEPYIDTNSRTMTPFRAVGEALGLSVAWDSATREASFTNGAKTIYFPIGSTTARTSDGGTVTMDTSAVIVNGRTYAPIRYLAEFFGYTVDWDGVSRTVIIE